MNKLTLEEAVTAELKRCERVAKEEAGLAPMTIRGKPVVDADTGKPLMRRANVFRFKRGRLVREAK